MKTFILFAAFQIAVITVSAQDDYAISINGYQSNYKKDLSDIIQRDTAMVRFYPVEPAYKVTASVERLVGQPFFKMAASDGQGKQAVKFAIVRFELMGKQYSLIAYQLSNLISSPEYKDNFFIPFTDASSGITSYAGGRYLDFVIKDISADGKLDLDFNKAYNPYCAFRDGYSCPIPPSENDLPVEIKAGEMIFKKK